MTNKFKIGDNILDYKFNNIFLVIDIVTETSIVTGNWGNPDIYCSLEVDPFNCIIMDVKGSIFSFSNVTEEDYILCKEGNHPSDEEWSSLIEESNKKVKYCKLPKEIRFGGFNIGDVIYHKDDFFDKEFYLGNARKVIDIIYNNQCSIKGNWAILDHEELLINSYIVLSPSGYTYTISFHCKKDYDHLLRMMIPDKYNNIKNDLLNTFEQAQKKARETPYEKTLIEEVKEETLSAKSSSEYHRYCERAVSSIESLIDNAKKFLDIADPLRCVLREGNLNGASQDLVLYDQHNTQIKIIEFEDLDSEDALRMVVARLNKYASYIDTNLQSIVESLDKI